MSFQTFKTFIHLWNTNKIFFDAIKIFLMKDSNENTTFKAQKGSKDIVKIVHVTSVVQP